MPIALLDLGLGRAPAVAIAHIFWFEYMDLMTS